MMRKKQGRCERQRRLQNDRREKMGRMFLYGTLCGVMMAAAVTFLVAIPANNDHWRVEIVKRGGGPGALIRTASSAGCGQLNRFPSLPTRQR